MKSLEKDAEQAVRQRAGDHTRRPDAPNRLVSGQADYPATGLGFPAGLLRLQRMVGNRAVGQFLHTTTVGPIRVVQRQSAEAAELSAKQAGFEDQEEAKSRAEAGERYDPKEKKWFTPGSETDWDLYIVAWEKSRGRMNMSFDEWSQARSARVKVDKTKPIDVDNDSALKALWGSASRFDKWDRAAVISKMFTDAGYRVGSATESTASSSATPPVLFTVEKHPMISLFEIHPGGGIHGGPYIRISSNSGMIKVLNSSVEPKYDPLTEARVKYVDVRIAGE